MKTHALPLLCLVLCLCFGLSAKAGIFVTNLPTATNIAGLKLLGLADGGRERLVPAPWARYSPTHIVISNALISSGGLVWPEVATEEGGQTQIYSQEGRVIGAGPFGEWLSVDTNGATFTGNGSGLTNLPTVWLGTTGLTWGSGYASSGLVTIGTPGAGGSLWINTQSDSLENNSGLGIVGTYGTPEFRSVIHINAYGINADNDDMFGSDLAFSTTRNDTLNEAMRIDRTGNLGIGTTTPSSKLEVAGTVTARNLALQHLETPPPIAAGGGMLWASNQVLYFVTATKTNLISDGR